VSEPATEVLRMVDIVKDFPGVRALDKVNLHANRGEILALVGENGAGKSTLMKVLSGVWPSDSYTGELYVKGQRRSFAGTRDAEEAGIAIIHQELNLVPDLTVAENVFLNRLPTGVFGLVDHRRLHAETEKLLASLGMDTSPQQKVRELTVGRQQLVEIAKALSIRADILILDEPTSALSDREVAELFRILRELKTRGVAMIYISHKMDELRQIADKVAVLRDGASIGPVEQMNAMSDDAIIARMVGREIRDLYPARPRAEPGRAVLEVEDMVVDHPLLLGERRVDRVSFQVHEGEILGITGLMGSGRTELVEGIFGAFPRQTHGRVKIDGREAAIRSPRDAIEAGIGLVTEDRKLLGLVLGMSVRENASLAVLDELAIGGARSGEVRPPAYARFARRALRLLSIVDRLEEKRRVDEIVQRLRVKTPSLETKVVTLSGGNQQKVVIAKWLLAKPKVLILDEPTRGVDVGAKAEIYQLMNELVRGGVAIIMISSELPEVLGMSDRILVMREGEKAAELSRAEATEERIMSYATLGAA
jgi:D-xylose transport system ATP-binding protein